MPGYDPCAPAGMQALLPQGVVAIEAFGTDTDMKLLPEEESILGTVAEVRRTEFLMGRTCARRALARLGCPAPPILRGPDREPLWPEGVVGSITHYRGYAAAAVASRTSAVAIGIDAEPHQELPQGILERIADPRERAWIEARRGSGTCWDRLLFSAKESTYKAWFPLTGRWLGFEDASVEIDPESNCFSARLAIEGPLLGGCRISEFRGRFVIDRHSIRSAIVIGAPKGG